MQVECRLTYLEACLRAVRDDTVGAGDVLALARVGVVVDDRDHLQPRRREFCHFDDTPLFIPIEKPTKGTGGVPSNVSLADG